MNPGNVLQMPFASAINAFATDLTGLKGFQASACVTCVGQTMALQLCVRACMRGGWWGGGGVEILQDAPSPKRRQALPRRLVAFA